VIDNCDLDQPGSDIQTDGGLFATEGECHWGRTGGCNYFLMCRPVWPCPKSLCVFRATTPCRVGNTTHTDTGNRTGLKCRFASPRIGLHRFSERADP
jgi:hypothetical protein